ncbi:hypothetical protein SASPL_157993 [Salvia splendens]|uniref:Uncharacterized protein n=1 Tax=Salvia splendens TaxID=180675 RepID=A0A8X8VU00_SALSN|nr:uncharacterized protein LOC121788803 [Salvia splendens]KAG6382340.1 hypothetical protein SASPL_157993 [Salvia splendens]
MSDRKPSPELRHAAAAACTGKSCQSCTAGAIADCVALCCCPCAVASCFVLAFFKLPWAMARLCLRWGRRRRVEERKCAAGDGESEKAKGGMIEIEVSEAAAAAGDVAEEWWLEVGHLGFGRVSSARINLYTKGN